MRGAHRSRSDSEGPRGRGGIKTRRAEGSAERRSGAQPRRSRAERNGAGARSVFFAAPLRVRRARPEGRAARGLAARRRRNTGNARRAQFGGRHDGGRGAVAKGAKRPKRGTARSVSGPPNCRAERNLVVAVEAATDVCHGATNGSVQPRRLLAFPVRLGPRAPGAKRRPDKCARGRRVRLVS